MSGQMAWDLPHFQNETGKITLMKPSLAKLHKFFKLEAERGYDNHAVVGGLERMLDFWEAEARADELPDDLIQAVNERVRAYARLTVKSRAETLEGLWRRIQRQFATVPQLNIVIPESQTTTAEPADAAETPNLADQADTPEALFDQQEQTRQQPPVEQRSPTEQQPLTDQTSSAKSRLARRSSASVATPGEPAALNAPVNVLTGIGPRYAQTLSHLGIQTLRDMLYHFPRRYDDYTQLKPINRLKYGEEVTIIGSVQSIAQRSLKGGQVKMVEAIISDGSAALRVTWFNPWAAKSLSVDDQIVLSGKVDQYLGRMVMSNPEWEPIEQQHISTNRIVPIYPLTSHITQRWLRTQMGQVVSYWAPRIQDHLSEELRQSAEIFDLSTALMQIHFPDSWEDLKLAQERLAFDEILLLQLGVLRQKRAWNDRAGRIYHTEDAWVKNQTAHLPFPLTNAQQRALHDIRHNLASGHPMNRLLQGDVGSGKTIVAALAMSIVIAQGAQAALMAPTSILAEQHYKNMLKTLAGVGRSPAQKADENEETASTELATYPLQPHEIRLMVGATPEDEKQEIRDGLAAGSIKLIIGTHALIESPITFADLQFVVVDEQHRFGVEQRAALRAKGQEPHLLVMTATPIPRSLALTIYGDLDLSVMDEMPPGRQPVSTHILMPREIERAYALIRSQAQQGRQAFIIYPLVEESENSEAKAAIEEQERLQKEIFPNLKVGLLHGRMRPEDKETVMTQFRDGEFHILVSTSVIEVGVDVPNATVMLIEGANRFGLAQLHQFRGRVGRGADKSYCLLVPDSPDQQENQRLQVMEETNDGFKLAERDLEQRGPGQFLGTRQAGYTDFQVANLTDIHLIEKARRHAQALFEQDPDLSLPQNQSLAEALTRSWGGRGDIS